MGRNTESPVHSSQTSHNSNSSPAPCGKCKLSVKDSDKGVECQYCSKWFHNKCSGTKKDTYQTLDKDEAVFWFCNHCKPQIKGVIANLKKFQNAASHIQAIKDEVDAKINGMTATIGELAESGIKRCDDIQQEFQETTTDLQNQLNIMEARNNDLQREIETLKSQPAAPIPPEAMQEQVRYIKRNILLQSLYNEENEQYERKDSIIIRNFKEWGPREDLVRITTDVCKAVGVVINAFEISVVHRFGRPTNDRPRPIIVKFTRRCVKSAVMRSKHKLQYIPDFQRVFIEENLTDFRAKLVMKLKRRPEVSRVTTIDGKVLFTFNNQRLKFNTGTDFLDNLPLGDDFLEEVNLDPELRFVYQQD